MSVYWLCLFWRFGHPMTSRCCVLCQISRLYLRIAAAAAQTFVIRMARLCWKDTMWANAIEDEDEDSFEKKRSFRALVHKCCSATPEVMVMLRGGKWLVQKWKKKKYQLHIASKMGGNHPRVISCKQSPMGQVAALDWMPQSAPARFSLPRSERRS